MIAAQADDGSRDLTLKVENRRYASLAVRTPVDVVAEEDDRVPRLDDRSQLIQQIGQGGTIPVHIADGDGGHVSRYRPGSSINMRSECS